MAIERLSSSSRADMEARVDEAMKKAEKVEKKQLKADNAAIEADAKEAEKEREGRRSPRPDRATRVRARSGRR